MKKPEAKYAFKIMKVSVSERDGVRKEWVVNPETLKPVFYTTAVSEKQAINRIKHRMLVEHGMQMYGYDFGSTAVEFKFVPFVEQPKQQTKVEYAEQNIFDFL